MQGINGKKLRIILEEKAEQYNSPEFISSDPIQIPHRFSKKEDIEIIGFLVSTIAWGNRAAIIKSGERLLEIMQHKPYEFILNYEEEFAKQLHFVHRTFNSNDLDFFFRSLKHIYLFEGGLENTFKPHPTIYGANGRIISFRTTFLQTIHEKRSEKHLSDPAKNSAAKRLNMFLRWMVRSDQKGVDFGIWKSISMHELNVPLDVHTSNVGRKLGLIERKQDDAKTLHELMEKLREFDPIDPSKYDFALFGIGAFEKI